MDRSEDSKAPAPAGEVMGNGNRADMCAPGEAPASGWRVRLHTQWDEVDAAAWDALLAASPQPTPFLRHGWLAALTASGSACADTGWQPLALLLEDAQGRLRGACALYVKSHSYGEYVFDWAWAEAAERAGLAYYPKLLGAVPFTPVPGSRLLAADDAARVVLLQAVGQVMDAHGLSSAHLLFLAEADRAAVAAAAAQGWSLRRTVQFHWENRDIATPGAAPYADFDDFLGSLQRVKRKKIAQERRYVREAGVHFRVLRAAQITAADWDFFYRCYAHTYRAHRSRPYLTPSFFSASAQAVPDAWLMFVAEREGQAIGASLVALDAASRTAWGRYWGALEQVSCLHFEACYYQPLAWCIAQGWRRFEGGAQGEHKMARGLLPVTTWSAHRLADGRLAAAVGHFLRREGDGMAAYVDELQEHSPYRDTPPQRPGPAEAGP